MPASGIRMKEGEGESLSPEIKRAVEEKVDLLEGPQPERGGMDQKEIDELLARLL